MCHRWQYVICLFVPKTVSGKRQNQQFDVLNGIVKRSDSHGINMVSDLSKPSKMSFNEFEDFRKKNYTIFVSINLYQQTSRSFKSHKTIYTLWPNNRNYLESFWSESFCLQSFQLHFQIDCEPFPLFLCINIWDNEKKTIIFIILLTSSSSDDEEDGSIILFGIGTFDYDPTIF